MSLLSDRTFTCMVCRIVYITNDTPGWGFRAGKNKPILIGPICDHCFQQAYPNEDPWENEWCPWLMGHVVVQAF